MSNTEQQPAEGQEPTIQQLREAADRGREDSARADLLAKELAFVKAGIDTSAGTGKLALGAYTGEATPEAVKAWAEAEGLTFGTTTTDPPPPPPAADPQQQAALEQRNGHTADPGAPPPPADDVQTVDAAFEELAAKRRAGVPDSVAQLSVVDTLASRAAAGKEDAIWTGWTPEQLAMGRASQV